MYILVKYLGWNFLKRLSNFPIITIPTSTITGGKKESPILIDLDAVSFMHAIDRKYITKYSNKLKINAYRVESMKDWKKKARAKTSIAHKKNIKNKK